MTTFNEKDLLKLIKRKEWKTLRNAIPEFDHLQLAEIIDRSSEFESVILFRFLAREQAKDVFQELSHEKQEE
ncbi:MAG: hypothetical protein VB075_10590, partial [Petrimonas sp.]|nr:hypothetical protein [Petrimonas sp.]MEA5045000.1 hypothetical protein [Petrimonas sp.]